MQYKYVAGAVLTQCQQIFMLLFPECMFFAEKQLLTQGLHFPASRVPRWYHTHLKAQGGIQEGSDGAVIMWN